MSYPIVELDPKRERTFFRHRHPWVFSRAIVETELPPDKLHGKIVTVMCKGNFVMHAYYNRTSQIALRALSWNKKDVIDADFFAERIKEAFEIREKYVLSPSTTACRMIFAESDFLPGFILDRYNNSYILQIHTYGAESLKKLFVEGLLKVVKPRMLYERSDVSARKLDGLANAHEELLYGSQVDTEIILENGVKFEVDLMKGQKTGFFLDQRENRKAIQRFVKDKHVLNLFSYTGGFSINAALAGASYVESVDISPEAVVLMKKNFDLNGVPEKTHKEVEADVFDFLTELTPGHFDVIILDPPAFVKSAKNIEEGMKGYLAINQMALQKLPRKGILVTSSCSAAVEDAVFFRMLNWAAQSAGCNLQVFEKLSQPIDHPLTPYFPEGNYLKFYILRKL